MADELKPLERRVFDARRRGEIKSDDTPGQIDEAERLGVLTAEEAETVRRFDARVMELTGVDDFDPAQLSRKDLKAKVKRKKVSKKSGSREKKPKTNDS